MTDGVLLKEIQKVCCLCSGLVQDTEGWRVPQSATLVAIASVPATRDVERVHSWNLS